ncbi:MAG: hypothetical protein A3K10_16515 [Bacteroidetes bacterium RIFCSPLOWO2_12_FULL_31_6]|nr:MAG: hypothetical protein A3K10_16515 [Bacteroidetes bacterium RIFCSPLOWO2_12_FULL_31_6]
MHKFYLIICFLILPLYNYAQTENNTITLSGIVFNKKDGLPVPKVSIMNYRTLDGVICTSRGYFEITIEKGDSLCFTSMGFDNYTLSFNENNLNNLKIYLTEATYNLKEITIWPYANKDEFRKAFKELKLPKELALDLHLPKINAIDTYSSYEAPISGMPSGLSGGYSIGGAFSALYEKYSKAGKERTAYKELLVKDSNKKMVALKYNADFVKKVTGIIDDEQAESLMDYCCLPEEFVLNNNEYDLVLAVQDCYAEYVK